LETDAEKNSDHIRQGGLLFELLIAADFPAIEMLECLAQYYVAVFALQLGTRIRTVNWGDPGSSS
jgi:hypothetical protein